MKLKRPLQQEVSASQSSKSVDNEPMQSNVAWFCARRALSERGNLLLLLKTDQKAAANSRTPRAPSGRSGIRLKGGNAF
jgi:hypothetical protein